MRRVNWSENELRASVKAYTDMLILENSNIPYIKAAIIRDLMAGVLKERTKGSIERRFSNISSVLNDMGRPWVKGYKPASHVGENVKGQIIEFITELDSASEAHTQENFSPSTQKHVLSKDKNLKMPTRGPAPREHGYIVPPKLAGEGKSHVYIARFSKSDIFKIGYSAKPMERLSNFNEHIPSHEIPELAVWQMIFVSEEMVEAEAYSLEQKILNFLSNSRTVGERVEVSEERMVGVLKDFFGEI